MARGVNLQAVSTDGSLNFNVYLFNVQPGIQFNYQNGDSSKDANMQVPTPADAPNFSNNNNSRQQGNHHYYRHFQR